MQVDPAVDWAMMSEGAYAIRAGAIHVATNTDATPPTERGFALGNGSLVAAVANATGEDYRRGQAVPRHLPPRPGARGASARWPWATASTPTTGLRAAARRLHVLTGVSSARDVLLAAPEERPGFLHTDLRGLLELPPAGDPGRGRRGPRCGPGLPRPGGRDRPEWRRTARRRARPGRPVDVALDAYWRWPARSGSASTRGAAPEVPELRVVGAPRS